jgi:hypothetical protein
LSNDVFTTGGNYTLSEHFQNLIQKYTRSKIDAILKVIKPENVTQLRSFLGLVQYYGKFLQNLATEARPLNELLEKSRKWKKSLHSAKYIVKIFQVFLFRLTGHDHIVEYTLDTF